MKITILLAIAFLLIIFIINWLLHIMNKPVESRYRQFLNPWAALIIFWAGTLLQEYAIDLLIPLLRNIAGDWTVAVWFKELLAHNPIFDALELVYYGLLTLIFIFIVKPVLQKINNISGFAYLPSVAGGYYIRDIFKSIYIHLSFWLGDFHARPIRLPLLPLLITLASTLLFYIFSIPLPPELLLIVFVIGKEWQYYLEYDKHRQESEEDPYDKIKPKPLKIGKHEDFWRYCHEDLRPFILTSIKDFKKKKDIEKRKPYDNPWAEILNTPWHPDISKSPDVIEDTHNQDDTLTGLSGFDIFGPVLIGDVISRIAKNQKVIFVLAYPNWTLEERTGNKDDRYFLDFEKWLHSYFIRAGFTSDFCKIHLFRPNAGSHLDQNASILLISPRDVYQLNTLDVFGDWIEKASLLVTDDLTRLFKDYALETRFFIEEITRRQPHIKLHFLTDDREESEGGLTNNLSRKPHLKDKIIHTEKPSMSYLILWALERNLGSKMSIGGHDDIFYEDHLIAAAATCFDFDKIDLVTSHHFPSEEARETLQNEVNSLRFPKYSYLNKEIVVQIEQIPSIRSVDNHLVSIENRKIFTAFDFHFNLSSLVKRLEDNSAELSFINIISPRYMLRDYMADNLPYFSELTMRAYSYKSAVSIVSAALHIYHLLTLDKPVTEEQIKRIINQLPSAQKANNRQIYIEIADIFKEVFHVYQRPEDYLNVSHEKIIKNSKVETQLFYRMTGEFNNDFFVDNFTNIEIREIQSDTKLIDINPDNHIPDYLPGKTVTIRDKAYIVKEFDKSNRIIRVDKLENEPFLFNCRHYAQYLINNSKSRKPTSFKDGKINKCTYEFESCYQVDGLFRWSKNLNEKLLDQEEQHFIRYPRPIQKNMPYGKAMQLTIDLNGELRKHWRKISQSLALLLQEMMPTFFPENHERIRVIPIMDKPRLLSIRPHLTAYGIEDSVYVELVKFAGNEHDLNKNPEDENNINLLFAEVSQMNIGIIATLDSKIKDLLAWLYDYLIWLEGLPPGGGSTEDEEVNHKCAEKLKESEGGKTTGSEWNVEVDKGKLIPLSGGDGHLGSIGADKKQFLKYGEKALPEFLDIKNTILALESLGPGILEKSQKRLRSIIVFPPGGDKSSNIPPGKHQCDNCGKFEDPVNMCKVKEDEREICDACVAKYLPNTPEAYEEILNETKRIFKEKWDIDIDTSTKIIATDAKTIDLVINWPYVPTRLFDSRAVGYASGSNLIALENFRDREGTLSTAIHEYTHIWQYQNLDYAKMNADYGKLLIEGHAVWASVVNFPQEKSGWLARDDEYGNGFKLILEIEAKTGKNPFQFLKEMYPKI